MKHWNSFSVLFAVITFWTQSLDAREYTWGLFMPSNMNEETQKWAELSKFIFYEKADTVHFVPLASEQDLKTAVESQKIDFVILRPQEYLNLKEIGTLQAVGSLLYKGEPHHFSYFIVNQKSTVKKITDLKRKRLGLGKPNSASSYRIPMAELKRLGIKPAQFFKSVQEGLSHRELELGVMRGQFDVAVNSSINREGLIREGKLKASDTRIIWTSEPIPNELLVASTQFLQSAPGKKSLERLALLQKKEPAASASLQPLPAPWSGIGPVQPDLLKQYETRIK